MARTVAVITGASGGIGQACAEALASGARAGRAFDCVLHYQNNGAAAEALAARLSQAYGVRACALQANLGQAGRAAELIAQAAERLGPPEVLIHAAGHIIEKPLSFTSIADWDSLLEVHAISGAALAKEFLRYARKAEHGRIVFIGSLAGVAGLGNGAAYAAAKGALQGLCRSLALEAARWKITVNVVAPGYVETALTAAQDADQKAANCKRVPLERYGRPEEIGALTAFLCAPEAAYLTGQTLVVDGGMSLG